MEPKVRRVLMWGGLFLLAYAGGSLLGRFAVTDLVEDSGAMLRDGEAANFWAEQDRRRAEASPKPAAQPHAYGQPGNHACDGCDAHITRDKQMAAMMGLPYVDPREATEASAPDAPDVPPPPPLPARP